LLGTSPLVQQSILRDLEEDTEGVLDDEEEDVENDAETILSGHAQRNSTGGEFSLATSYRRISAIPLGPRPFFPGAQPPAAAHHLNEHDRELALGEERSLLRDNQIIPPKHPRPRGESIASVKSQSMFNHRLSINSFIPRRKSLAVDEDAVAIEDEPSETTPLNRDLSLPYGGEDNPENIDKKWTEAVASGKIQTTWQREAKVLAQYSWPLMVTFLLQYSLTVVSIFFVGHLGVTELGAVSLGSMSANITGYSTFIGLATSLDTLCPQAYGSGKKKLVGLQLQRMVFFLWCIVIPVSVVWAFGPQVLAAVTPEKEIAHMAGQYLRILILGAPAYAAFEAGKRFVQAQGLFQANLYCLMFCAPLNVFLHWLFVIHLEMGYIGAPISLVIVENMLPICLFCYVRFIGGMECWTPITIKAFHNWGPMIKLALPGLIMVLAEFLAFEILTLSSSYISATHLAVQSILGTISCIAYQIPFPVSIASSTRIANLIGATLADAAKVAAKVALVAAVFLGCFNAILLVALRQYLPMAFSGDKAVLEMSAAVLPMNAAFQLFDALAALANGVLRGLGRQEIGGYVNLFAYYVVRIPCCTNPRDHKLTLSRSPCRYLLVLASDLAGVSTDFGLVLPSLSWSSQSSKDGSFSEQTGTRLSKLPRLETLLASDLSFASLSVLQAIFFLYCICLEVQRSLRVGQTYCRIDGDIVHTLHSTVFSQPMLEISSFVSMLNNLSPMVSVSAKRGPVTDGRGGQDQ